MLQGKLFVNILDKSIIINYYDYSSNNYRKMMRKVDFKTDRQVIITTSMIKKILHKVSQNDNLLILDINFLECIDPDDEVEYLINLLKEKDNKDKQYVIKLLNKELDVLSSEKGIDIKSIELVFIDKGCKVRLKLYSNGIITAETKDKEVINLFVNKVLQGIINE